MGSKGTHHVRSGELSVAAGFFCMATAPWCSPIGWGTAIGMIARRYSPQHFWWVAAGGND